VPVPPIDAVVLIVEGPATCAGAFVDDHGLIATAYHCIAAGGRPMVTTRDGRHAPARIVASDVAHDLALLRVDGMAGPFLPVRADVPALGDPVTAIGHPFGSRAPGGFLGGTLRWSASAGAVSAIGDRALQISAPVNPGNSGGPVVDDQGEIVGVVSRRLTGDGLGFAGRGDALAALIADPDRGSPIGGTLSVTLFATAWNGDGGVAAFGGRGGAAIRDRVWFDFGVGIPARARWDAVSAGEITWIGGEARGGLRQRLFRGPACTFLDVYGGVDDLQTRTGDRVTLAVRPSSEVAPIVGGAVTFPGLGFGLDGGVVYTDGVWTTRGEFTVQWPGEISIF
jgi:hypothetical protein